MITDTNTLVRKNILELDPYSSAREEFKGNGHILLDANENPVETGFNRYPDPNQSELKGIISKWRKVDTDRIFLGNGSDEAIDLLIRCYCEPGIDNVIIPVPTYDMYRVFATINSTQVRSVLRKEDFTLDIEGLLNAADQNSKILFLCSPNNPTGNSVPPEEIENLVQNFNGLVVVDEAYIDFSPHDSLLSLIKQYPNLVILQTFSKALGLAGLRVGIAYSSPEVIGIINKVKPPYNLNTLSLQNAADALRYPETTRMWVETIQKQKEVLCGELRKLDSVLETFSSDSNFLLVKFKDADNVYKQLIERGIVVRNRSKAPLLEGCLRITVGTEQENINLIKTLKSL